MSWPNWNSAWSAGQTVSAATAPTAAIAPNAAVATALSTPGTIPVNPAQYTAEQWATMQQQNWQQWVQWQQQYQQWQQQYGEQYQKSLSALSAQTAIPPTPVVPAVPAVPAVVAQQPIATVVQPPLPATFNTQPPLPFSTNVAPPPLPPDSKPPPPPEQNQQVTSTVTPTYNYSQPPPNMNTQPLTFNKPPPNQFSQPPPPVAPPPPVTTSTSSTTNSTTASNFTTNTSKPPPSLLSLRVDKPTFDSAAPVPPPPQNKRKFNDQNRFNENVIPEKTPRTSGGWNSQSSQQDQRNEPNVQLQQPKPGKKSINPNEITEAERKFDEQFKAWEEQFNKWKEQNANHPDKQQYKEYEAKWEAWRNQLLERREQMRKKRMGLAVPKTSNKITPPLPVQATDLVQKKPPPQQQPQAQLQQELTTTESEKLSENFDSKPLQEEQQDLPTKIQDSTEPKNDFYNEPPKEQRQRRNRRLNDASTTEILSANNVEEDTNMDESNTSSNYEFMSKNDSSGIPGLDLVDEKSETKVEGDTNEKKAQPDLSAISRGIDSILGDQNLANIISLVSQQKQGVVDSNKSDQNVELNSDQNNSQLDSSNSSQSQNPSYVERSNDSKFIRNSQIKILDNRPYQPPFDSQSQIDRPPYQETNLHSSFGTQHRPPFESQQQSQFTQRPASDSQQRPPFDNQRPPLDNQRGPLLDSQRSSFDNQRPPFDNQRPSFDNQRGPSFDNQRGPSFDNQRPPFENQPRSLFDNPRSLFDNQRPPFDNQRSSFDNQRGPPQFDNQRSSQFDNQRPPFDNQRPPFDNQRPSFDNQRGPPFDNQRGPSFDNQRGPSFDNQRGPPFDNQRGPPFDNQRGPPFDNQRGPPFDNQRGPPFDNQRGPPFDNQRGPPFDNQRGPPFDNQRGPPFDSQRSSFDNQRGPPPFDDRNRGPNFNNQNDNRFSNDRQQFDRFGQRNDDDNSDNNRFGGGLNQQQRFDNKPPALLDLPMVKPVSDPWLRPPPILERERMQPPNDNLNRPPLFGNENLSRPPPFNEQNMNRPPPFGENLNRPPPFGENLNRPPPFGENMNRSFNENMNLDKDRTFNENPPTNTQFLDKNLDVKNKPVELGVTEENIAKEGSQDDINSKTEWEGDILAPATIIDYGHKSLAQRDEDAVFIEPAQTIDYEHQSKNVPINESPKPSWSQPKYSDKKYNRDNYTTSSDFSRSNWKNNSPYEGYKREESRDYSSHRSNYGGSGSNEKHNTSVGYDRRYGNNRSRSYDESSMSPKDRYERRSSYHYDKRNQDGGDKISSSLPPPPPISSERKIETLFPAVAESSNISTNPSLSLLEKETEKHLPIQNVTLIEDLLSMPGRANRPPRIVIILRGPPGSGKTFLAKLIKDKEVSQGGSAPRILSLDDYFMVEIEKDSTDPETGRKIKTKEMVYEYEQCMETAYLSSLVKAFKKTITDGFFSFIIVDCVNHKVKQYEEMWSFAKQNGFQVYVCQMELDVTACTKRNIHGRTEDQIRELVDSWESTPVHHLMLDATSLLQAACISEVEMDEVSDDDNLQDLDSPKDIDDDDQAADEAVGYKSKWDLMEPTFDKLARLDGISKPLRHSTQSMEDYLQLNDEWKEPEAKPGQKRVRWADLVEKREQEKMRAIGFVVGQTDWNRMMDPSQGSSALTQTKFIEPLRKY